MTDGPLSKPLLADVRRAAARAADCRIRIQRASAAGIDVTDQEVRCDHLQRALQQVIDVYASTPMDTMGTKNG